MNFRSESVCVMMMSFSSFVISLIAEVRSFKLLLRLSTVVLDTKNSLKERRILLFLLLSMSSCLLIFFFVMMVKVYLSSITLAFRLLKCFLSYEFRYESSGYDEASFRKVYHSSPLPKKFSGASASHSPLTVTQIVGGQSQQQQQQQHTIESGPSFNESLERFRMATSSGNESDGDQNGPGSAKTSVFRQQRQQQQSYSSSTNQSSSIQRSVQEQRTMITRNSQKSYHIEWEDVINPVMIDDAVIVF